MNNITTIAPERNLPAVRTIPEIEADILAQKRTIGASIVFIGQALIEAKGQLTHGEWGRWLAERVEFSTSSAENYMRIAREFEGGSALLSLPYSKVLALLPVPREERESFARENGIEDKSVSQIKQLIRERDEARQRAKDQEKVLLLKENNIRILESQLSAEQARKPETVTVEKEVIPEDYEAVKIALADAKDIIEMTKQERDDALEKLAEERLSGGYQDPLDVGPFCDACAALLNRLYAAPHAKAMFMTRGKEELKRYESNVRLIMEWAVKTQDAIDAAQSEKFGEERIFSIL